MLGRRTVSYTKLKTAMENDIMNRFPAISQHISAINIDKNHLSADIQGAGLAIARDSEQIHIMLSAQKSLMLQRLTSTNRWILLYSQE